MTTQQVMEAINHKPVDTSKYQRLTGDALLTCVNENSELEKAEKVKLAGYINQDGKPSYADFYIALLEAKGVNMNEPSEPITSIDGEQQVTISFAVTHYYTIAKDVNDGVTKEEIIESITRDEFFQAECDGAWDDMKDAWRSNEPELFTVYNEQGEEIA